jgi:hypothetical protein
MEWFKTKRSSPTTGAALLRQVPARLLVSFAFTRTPPVFVSVRSHACSQRRFDTQPFPQEPDKPVEGKDGAAVACVFACCSRTFAVRSVTVLRLLRSQPRHLSLDITPTPLYRHNLHLPPERLIK